ncbi:MAG: lytic transglycosylase domain-containing protein [Gammaproteobacteria bacterium]|nr:lytic transglycosylase domain-containing protein [Gammaproteobacteria bacterium]
MAYRVLQGLSGLVFAAYASLTVASNPIFDPELRQRLIEAINSASSFQDRFEAEVWLLDMSTRLQPYIQNSRQRLQLLKNIHREAKRAELQPELVLAVIDIESRFDRFAVSRAGAQGLMQIMPFWLNEIGQPNDNLLEINTNLRMGCTILKYYLDKEKGDLRRALARYNGSLGSSIYPDKILETLRKRWFRN